MDLTGAILVNVIVTNSKVYMNTIKKKLWQRFVMRLASQKHGTNPASYPHGNFSFHGLCCLIQNTACILVFRGLQDVSYRVKSENDKVIHEFIF